MSGLLITARYSSSRCSDKNELGWDTNMTVDTRKFIDFWMENSLHAAEPYGAAGAEQVASKLASRCIAAAATQGLTKADLEAEVGDLETVIQARLVSINLLDHERRRRLSG